MVTIFDVAKYILEKQGAMSTWKLQKLCYYAQAWHYTWTEKRLIVEEFQAWRNDPVCPELYNAHKGKFMIVADELKQGNAEKLNDDEEDSVNVVLEGYGQDEPFYQTRRKTPPFRAGGYKPHFLLTLVAVKLYNTKHDKLQI